MTTKRPPRVGERVFLIGTDGIELYDVEVRGVPNMGLRVSDGVHCWQTLLAWRRSERSARRELAAIRRHLIGHHQQKIAALSRARAVVIPFRGGEDVKP